MIHDEQCHVERIRTGFYYLSVVFRPAGAKNDRQKKKSTMLPQAKAMLCVSSMLVGIVDR